jgi:hypothetical protein
MIKPHVKLIALMSAGPYEPLASILDTLESILHYCTPSVRIILCDNSGKNIGNLVQQTYPEIIVLKIDHISKYFSEHYTILSSGMTYAVEHFTFDVLLKMDVDTLIIGPAPEDDAIRVFEANKHIGELGQWPYGDDGRRHNYRPVGLMLFREILNPLRLRSPISANLTLLKLYLKARAKGYVAGDHVFGGGNFYRYETVVEMYLAGLLPSPHLGKVRLHDDHLSGLIVKALGWELGDLATDPLPVLETWRGLPCSPDELVRRNKKVTHSVRFYNDMKEDDIRAFFRARRHAVGTMTRAAA